MSRIQDITRSLDPVQITARVTCTSCRMSMERIRMTGSGFSLGSEWGWMYLPHRNPLPEGEGVHYIHWIYPSASLGGNGGVEKADLLVCRD